MNECRTGKAIVSVHEVPTYAVLAYSAHWCRVLQQAQQRVPTEAEPPYWHAYFTEEKTYADQPSSFLVSANRLVGAVAYLLTRAKAPKG